MTLRLAMVGLSLLVACCGATDERACTAIGCADGLRLTLDATSGWKPGSYVFTVTADGAELECEGSLPLPACGTPGLTCKGEQGVAQIGESGCALPKESHAFGEVQISYAPAKVTVKVTHDGAVLAEQTFTPTYVTSRPNGPACEPVCRQASGVVTLK